MTETSSQKSERNSNKENSFTQSLQRVDLHYFERRGGRCILKHLNDGSLEIHSGINSDILAIGIHLIVEALLTGRRTHGNEQFISKTSRLKLQLKEGVDKEQLALNHEDTIMGLLNSAMKKLETMKEDQCVFTRFELHHIVASTVNQYPALEFALIAFVRAKGSLHLSEQCEKYRYSLFGNEQRLLRDYSANIRNMPLKLVADAIGINLAIEYQGCHEEHTNPDHTSKLTIASFKNQRSILKYDHQQQSTQPVPPIDGLAHLQVSYCPPRRDNSRLSIESNANSEYRCTETSRSKPSKTCAHCGRVKTERFCECRKNGTPKNSQKGSNSALRTVDKGNKGLISHGNNSSSKRCKKCKTSRQLFMDDEYCGQCIGVFGIKRCSNCNQLYQLSCLRCRRS